MDLYEFWHLFNALINWTTEVSLISLQQLNKRDFFKISKYKLNSENSRYPIKALAISMNELSVIHLQLLKKTGIFFVKRLP